MTPQEKTSIERVIELRHEILQLKLRIAQNDFGDVQSGRHDSFKRQLRILEEELIGHMPRKGWRVGGRVPLNVHEDDRPMFQCHTPEDAARVVKLLNDSTSLDARIHEALMAYESVRPADQWSEESGSVLWWHFPISEPPYVGGLSDCNPDTVPRLVKEGWLTHWSRLPIVWGGDGQPKRVATS